MSAADRPVTEERFREIWRTQPDVYAQWAAKKRQEWMDARGIKPRPKDDE